MTRTKRIIWIALGAGSVVVAVSFVILFTHPELFGQYFEIFFVANLSMIFGFVYFVFTEDATGKTAVILLFLFFGVLFAPLYWVILSKEKRLFRSN